eukprot:7198274-Prymnesium_polylepis.1
MAHALALTWQVLFPNTIVRTLIHEFHERGGGGSAGYGQPSPPPARPSPGVAQPPRRVREKGTALLSAAAPPYTPSGSAGYSIATGAGAGYAAEAAYGDPQQSGYAAEAAYGDPQQS